MSIELGTLERTNPRAGLLMLPPYPLRIEPEELRSAWIVGQPGFGKSTFLGNLAESFADVGEGVLLIDIKGDLAEQVAARTKYPERVIYLDPAGAHLEHRYHTLNPLDFDRTNRLNFELYGNSLFETFVYIGEVAPEMMKLIRKVMKEAIHLALAKRGTTLTDVYLMLHDPAHRLKFLTASGVPPQTVHYWVEVFPATEREQRHVVESTDSRIRESMEGPYLSYMLNQPHSSLQLVQWLNEGKLIICDFNQSKLSPSTATRLGNLLLGYMAGEINKRPTGERGQRWRIIVDEAHELATIPFARMVTQMRTYSAYPVIASQSRTQMEKHPELVAAADQTSAQFELMLPERDLANLRWTRSAEDLEAARSRAEFTARYRLTKPPKGIPAEGAIGLLPWHREPDPDQLTRLKREGIERAVPRSNLRDLYDFDAFVKAKDKAKDHATKTVKTGKMASGSGPSQKGTAGGDQSRGPAAGAAGSDPVSDRTTSRQPVFHRAYPGRADSGGGTGAGNAGG